TKFRKILQSQLGQPYVFFGQMVFSIGLTMNKRILAKPAISSRGRPSDALTFNQHHLALRVALFSLQSSPKSGVATTNHKQVSSAVAVQTWCRGRALWRMHTIRGILRTSQCVVDTVLPNVLLVTIESPLPVMLHSYKPSSFAALFIETVI